MFPKSSSLYSSGQLRGSVHRRVYDHCWLGSCDGCCADEAFNRRTEVASSARLSPARWTHVVLCSRPDG